MDIDISCMTWLPTLCGQLRRLFVPNHTIKSSILLLPDDIIVNIFSRLDAECAFQCSCLCRSLSIILSTPYFLSAHCFQSAPSIIFQCYKWRPLFDRSGVYGREVVLHCTSVSGNVVALRMKLKLSDVWPEFDSRPRLVASYNGLLLFNNLSLFHSAFFIWNPLTQEQVTIIAPKSAYHVCGFYIHPPTGEYRILCVHFQDSDVEFFILSLGTKLLRKVSNFSEVPCTQRPPVILNGALHWTASFRFPSFCSNFILLFKTDCEVFDTIPHPRIENCSRKRHSMMHLLDMKGNLGLCDVISPTDLHVWVLQEEQVWVRMHNISTKSVVPKAFHYVDYLRRPTLEAFYIQNDELLLKSHMSLLYSYHLKLNTFTAIDTDYFGNKSLISVVVQSNSMTSLHTDEFIFMGDLELQEL